MLPITNLAGLSQPVREKWAFIIALAFHVSGFIAIGIFKSTFFISLTWLNLLVCLALVLWTQPDKNRWFWWYSIAAAVIGFGTEYIGVTTGLLFGNYSYGSVMGWGINGVPLLIGVQWLVTTYCVGVAMHMLHHWLLNRPNSRAANMPKIWQAVSVVLDGAMLAVLFDWVLEPVAVSLGYWQWAGGEIPLFNYLTWYLVSVVILVLFHQFPFRKQNLFAVHLLLIQFMFFLLLRTVG
ncbi:MAG: carotenoid biosynthesis protein [Bacteroidetes bacterium]|uniref:carotenoid biosynthesis protein n=1 Tax=Phnomibacter sp. TaxID=2836217 RepID=UPI002FDCED6B|nr:carotenoid biosynthesis protein [Bacteroidota bacterium]